MTTIQIYTDQVTPRLQFACHILFKIVLKVPFKCLNVSAKTIETANNGILYYSSADQSLTALHVLPNGILSDSGLNSQHPEIIWKDKIPLLFPSRKGCQLGFDVFAATFYMASRYEEYLPFEPDNYGRFPEKASLSGKNNFTQLPVIHVWARLLEDKLKAIYPGLSFPEKRPSALFTYDIDVAYAYKGRAWHVHFLSLARDMVKANFSNISKKIQTRFGKKGDPSDTYNILENNKLEKIYFFLLSNKKSKYDRNISPYNPVLQRLITKLSRHRAKLGVHPSFFSSENPRLISEEKKYLENITQKGIEHSRQHFLRFRLPDTFQALIQAGILHEYSMQYPEMPGFRAGICLPFPFFDVRKNRITDLTIHPGCIMETTFRDDLDIPAAKSLDLYLSLWQIVKEVGGQFISIWHNDTLWEGLPDEHPLAFLQVHQKLAEIISTDLKILNKET